MKKVVIAGGRDFDNFEAMQKILDLIKWESDDVIVSGTARGADTLGEKYANLKGINVIRFPAQWSMYGRSAGFKRNEEMAKFCTHGIVFWDGKSKGSEHMINLLKKYNRTYKIIRYTKEDK